MIAAEAKLLTYAQAGERVGKGVRFIRERIREGRLIGTELGYNAKRVSELDLAKFIENSRTLERRRA